MTITVPTETGTTSDFSATLDSMVRFHKRFMFHKDDSTHDLAVLWAAHTYGMKVWRYTPRLYVTAPEPACGKTMQSDLIAFFTNNPQQAAHMSAAALFSVMEQSQPVVFMDEADKTFNNSWGRDNVLASVVNQGFSRAGKIMRLRKNVPTNFNVYGALAIIGIDNGCLPDDTQTRCIPVNMAKGKPAEKFGEYDHVSYQERIQQELTEHAQFWTKDVPMPAWLSGRTEDIWNPLFAVAHAAGGDWYERCERAAKVHQWRKQVSPQRATLAACKAWFDENTDDEVSSSALASWVGVDLDSHVTSPKGLANALRGYHVRPHRVRAGSIYRRADFVAAWGEWLD